MGQEMNDQALAEFDQLIERIEESAAESTWSLGDWLVEMVPNPGDGKHYKVEPEFQLDALSERSGKTERWLRELRRAADHFPPGRRMPNVSMKVHLAALNHTGSVDAALDGMREKRSLRDWAPSMDVKAAVRVLENPTTRKQALDMLPSEPQAAMARDLLDRAADERDWSPTATALAVKNLADNRLPESHKESLLAGETDPVAFGENGELRVPTEFIGREMKRALKSDKDLLLARFKEAVSRLRLFPVEAIVAELDGDSRNYLSARLPEEIAFLEELRIAVQRSEAKLAVVG